MSKVLAHNLDTGNRTEDVNMFSHNISFETMLLPEHILKGLTKTGFKRPSPIQLKAIPVGRCGFDLIVKSKAGTGKTLVFTVIALDCLNVSKAALQVLILVPTREVAVQIQDVFQKIGSDIAGLKVESFIGGLSLAEDREKSKSCQIAVGTPGRIKHLITDQYLKTNSVKLFILDEADKLVENSFLNDINEIYNSLPFRKQIITTSATYPNNLQEFLSRYMISPSFISVELNNPFLLGIKQFVKVIQESNSVQQMRVKNDTLIHIFSNISFTQCLVFTNYQNRAESISNILNQKGWQSTYISAAQSQVKRLEAIDNLKNFKCRILSTTDLTARGIDASNVDLVINYDIPIDPVTYLHRMGRAGRYGSSGICINLASAISELLQLQKILGAIGGTTLSIPQLPEFTGTLSDLLKVKIPEESYVFGIVGYFNVDLRKEILTMKNTDVKNDSIDSNKNDANDNQVGEQSQAVEVDDILKLLKDTQSEFNALRDEILERSQESILESLVSGDVNNGQESDTMPPITDSADVDMSTVKDILSISTKIVQNKANQDSSPNSHAKAEGSTKSVEADLQETQQDLICKNKALFEVAKMLTNPEDAKNDSVCNYLTVLKKQENEEASKLASTTNLTDILGMLENASNLQQIVEEKMESQKEIQKETTPISDLENIFQLGYENIVKNNGDYQSFIQEMSETFSSMECGSSDNEDSSDVEESDDTDTEPEIMKWVPVKKSSGTKKKVKITTSTVKVDDVSWTPIERIETVEQDEETAQTEQAEGNPVVGLDNYEHFMEYFNDSSNELWQYGLCFNNVNDFDNWYYYNWQSRLSSIREYVQQNIYVQELSEGLDSTNSKTNDDKK